MILTGSGGPDIVSAQVEPVEIPRTLVVTNDFPPKVGGVQQYVWNLVSNLPADRVAVVAPNWPGWREHDRAQPFGVHRWAARSMVPTEELGTGSRCRSSGRGCAGPGGRSWL